METIYCLRYNDSAFHFYYGDLTILCNSWKPEFLGVSYHTLIRYDWSKPYKNGKVEIHKSEAIKSTRKKKLVYGTIK